MVKIGFINIMADRQSKINLIFLAAVDILSSFRITLIQTNDNKNSGCYFIINKLRRINNGIAEGFISESIREDTLESSTKLNKVSRKLDIIKLILNFLIRNIQN